MKGDFSRLTFDVTRHYAGVRLQQGRMILDADWNEQADISDHQRITQLLDLVGESGAPSETPHGFELKVSTSQTQPEFTFQAGRLYAGGYLCELEHDLVLSEASLHDTATEIWRRFPQEVPEGSGKSPFSGPGSWLFYLDVWTRLVTYAEDERLVEPALGGLDTSLRLETVWQIRWMKDPGEGARSSAMGLDRRTGIRLNTRLSGGSLDNQLYRVEAHRGGTLDQADFKWARDNASVVAPIDAIDGDGTLITCGPTPWDIPDRFSPGDWVEVVNDRLELTGQPGPLARITRVLGFQLVVEWQPDDSAANLTGALRLRRWDGYFTAAAGSVELERGIAVQVELESGAVVRTGDFWILASRAGANSLEPPFHTGEALAPMGIFRRRVALATFRWDNQSSSWGDLRTVFAPLTRPLDVHDLGLKGLTLQDPNDENVDLHLSNIDGVLAVRRDLENAAHVDIDGNLAVGGNATVRTLTATEKVTSSSLSSSGALDAASATIKGAIASESATVTAELKSGTATVVGTIRAGAAAIASDLSAGTIASTGAITANSATIANSITGANITATGTFTSCRLAAPANQPLVLGTGALDAISVTQGGFVGIGQSSPTVKLDIAGNIKANGGQLTDDLTLQKRLIVGESLPAGTKENDPVSLYVKGNIRVDGFISSQGALDFMPQTSNALVVQGYATINSNATDHSAPLIIGPVEGEPRTTGDRVHLHGSNPAKGWRMGLDYSVDDTGTYYLATWDLFTRKRVLSVSSTGKVGLGTPTPSKTVDVVGDVGVSGSLGAGSTNVASLAVSGVSSLSSLTVSGATSLASLSASGTVTGGASTLASLTVNGATSLASLTVSGPITGGASALASLTVNTTLSAGTSTLGSLSVAGKLGAGESSIASLSVSGQTTLATLDINGVLNVTGKSALTGSVTVGATNSFAGLTVNGQLITGFNQPGTTGLVVMGAADVRGALTGTSAALGAISCSKITATSTTEASAITKQLLVGASTTTETEALVVKGSARFSGSMDVAEKLTATNAKISGTFEAANANFNSTVLQIATNGVGIGGAPVSTAKLQVYGVTKLGPHSTSASTTANLLLDGHMYMNGKLGLGESIFSTTTERLLVNGSSKFTGDVNVVGNISTTRIRPTDPRLASAPGVSVEVQNPECIDYIKRQGIGTEIKLKSGLDKFTFLHFVVPVQFIDSKNPALQLSTLVVKYKFIKEATSDTGVNYTDINYVAITCGTDTKFGATISAITFTDYQIGVDQMYKRDVPVSISAAPVITMRMKNIEASGTRAILFYGATCELIEG